jgi:hypothetical protein
MATIFDPSQVPGAQGNIIDNGGFEIWQRGTTFTNPAFGAYLCDRWSSYVNTSEYNATFTQESTTVDTVGLHSLKVNVTSVTTPDFGAVRQIVENYQDYRGKTLSMSVRCLTSVASMASLSVQGNIAGAVQSAYHPGDGQWHTLTVTITLPTNETGITIYLNVAHLSAIGISYWDNAMMTIGYTPALFVPCYPQEDLARCQRFYEISGSPYGVTFRSLGINNGGQYQLSSYQPFSVLKRVSPTIVLTPSVVWEQGSTTNVQASYGFTASNSDAQGFELVVSKSAGGNFPTLVQASYTASADF